MAIAPAAQAQQVDTSAPSLSHQLEALRVAQPPTIDGRLDESAWAQADAATDFRQLTPSPGASPSRPTVARVLYDDEHLYVGARMYDDPDSIAAQTLGRDAFGYTDRFVVGLGSYNNDRNAFVFRVSPVGSRVDGFISNDTDHDTNWDGVWTAETQIDSLGWTVELRIPLSQLRYAPVPEDSTAAWGLNFRRDIARRSETVSWAPLDPNVDRTVSLYGALRGLRGLPPTRNLEVEPYVAGQMGRPAESTSLQASTEWSGRVGGDVRYGLTPSTSLRATFNPDFGQVEADPSRINLSATETFFPEKRPFFVEGSDIFDVQDGPRLFYSRRIGRAPQGSVPDSAHAHTQPDQTTILGAAKLTGRTAGDWEIGALNAVTARERATIVGPQGTRSSPAVEPATNYGVARARRNLRDGNSTIGGIATTVHRPGLPARLQDEMHRTAYAGGVDGRHRFADETYEASGSLLGSQVRGTPDALLRTQTAPTHYFQRPDADHLALDSSRTQLSGWRAAGELEKISGRWRWSTSTRAESPGFEINDLGFLRRGDEVALDAGLTYLDAEAGATFREVEARLSHSRRWSFGGEPLHRSLYSRFEVTFHNNHSTGIASRIRQPALAPTPLRGGPALRENGRLALSADYRADREAALRPQLAAEYRTTFGTDGASYTIRPELRYRPSAQATVSLRPRLSVTRDPAQYVTTAAAGPDTEYVFGDIRRRTLAITTRASYTFSPEMTLNVYAQPFIGTGDYRSFSRVASARADAFSSRFASLEDNLSYDATDDVYRVAPTRDGQTDYSFANPDFTFEQLRSTVAFQWQYRRGSNLYVVWNRGQTISRNGADFDPAGGLSDLLAGGRNTFAIKLDFWLGV
ncbi:MAG: DUF5916 domain-containing protein [Salinibacter sp.]